MFEDISFFLKPTDTSLANLAESSWGEQLLIHTENSGLGFDEQEFDMAMVVVEESRNAPGLESGFLSAGQKIREYLYRMFPPDKNIRLLDLGDIHEGHEPKDTYFALRKVIDLMVRKNKFLFIIGSHKDLIYSQFAGYQDLEQTVNMVCLSHVVDISLEEAPLQRDNFLTSVILHQPNYLFNLSIYGMQEYYVNPKKLNLIDKLFFEAYRLGEFRDNPRNAEPIIRSADLLTIDLGAMKYSDFPAQYVPMPNGFTSEEICLLARYGGISDKLSTLGIYEYNGLKDTMGLGASLISQIIWCAMDGYRFRKNDFPSRSSDDYMQYHVLLEDGKYEINFYKSKKSGRWWMEVPYPPQKGIKFERHTLIPCSEEDYQLASKNEVPLRWLLTYNKLF
ncbi:MAG: arginase [Bacteroidia bacterium]|nr:arginase [Bacteroidia bacterium]